MRFALDPLHRSAYRGIMHMNMIGDLIETIRVGHVRSEDYVHRALL